MNCSSAIPNAETGVNLQSVTLITFLLLSELFLLICAFPVLKLARERIALYILASKIIPGFLSTLFGILDQSPVIYLFSSSLRNFILRVLVVNCSVFSLISIRLHIIALAANRAHALFFPFHYSQKMTRRIIFAQCVFMHLLAIALTPFYAYFFAYTWNYVIVSSSLYATIVLRLAWLKRYNRMWNSAQGNSTSDKDSTRITCTCFAIQIVAVFYVLYIAAANTKWFSDFLGCDPFGKVLFYPIQLILRANYVSDELLLLLICKEMRVNFVQLIAKVLPFCGRNGRATAAVVPIVSVAATSRQMPSVNVNLNGAASRRWAKLR
uniref:G protein-coupled receptor n=1 Tax=Globodera rostochiensis TaxID=31243 RepID=A0A914H5L0_GLORO